MDGTWTTVLTAVIAATLGGCITWLVERRLERARRTDASHDDLPDKLHEMDKRILRLELRMAYTQIGGKR